MSWLGGAAFAAAMCCAFTATAGLPPVCMKKQWRLKGASKVANTDADFLPGWRAPLREVAECLKAPEAAKACAEVEGRYDDSKFPEAIAKALGGDKSAQLHRARARALRVKTWLSDAGVAPHQLRERLPPPKPSWRGVLVRVVPDCTGQPPAEPSAEAPDVEAVKGAVKEALAEQPAPPPSEVTVKVEPVPPGARRWWLSAGTAATGLLADGVDNGVMAEFQVGLGWAGRFSYARVDTALTIGSPTGQARGLSSGLAGGWRAFDWLEVGLRFGHRVSGADYTAPWSDQILYGAVESSQCLTLNRDGLRACSQAYLGGGRWIARAVEVGDTQYFVPQTDRGVFILGALASVRQAF